MIQRRTPLKRGTKPLKRTPLKRGKGRRALAIDKLLDIAKDLYFALFQKNADTPCQLCRFKLDGATCHAHHKIKRSLRGGHGPDNLVILCHRCHSWAHDESKPSNLKTIRDSPANAENGRAI